jgi:hypothetical protein
MNGDDATRKTVQAVQIVQIVQAPSFILPRDAGEEEVGKLNGAQRLNSLNVLNLRCEDPKNAKKKN